MMAECDIASSYSGVIWAAAVTSVGRILTTSMNLSEDAEGLAASFVFLVVVF